MEQKAKRSAHKHQRNVLRVRSPEFLECPLVPVHCQASKRGRQPEDTAKAAVKPKAVPTKDGAQKTRFTRTSRFAQIAQKQVVDPRVSANNL